ncbi:hypothetical protein FKM82_030408 [Ascaphus truei]
MLCRGDQMQRSAGRSANRHLLQKERGKESDDLCGVQVSGREGVNIDPHVSQECADIEALRVLRIRGFGEMLCRSLEGQWLMV